MQRGFAWLDEYGAIVACREDLSQDEAVVRFLKDLDAHARSRASAAQFGVLVCCC